MFVLLGWNSIPIDFLIIRSVVKTTVRIPSNLLLTELRAGVTKTDQKNNRPYNILVAKALTIPDLIRNVYNFMLV
jgi:hypothetical protein